MRAKMPPLALGVDDKKKVIAVEKAWQQYERSGQLASQPSLAATRSVL
jgi:hypothetical protein